MRVQRVASIDPSEEDIAKRVEAGELPPIEVDTLAAFETAIATMLRTGRPILLPTRKELAKRPDLAEWVGALDELEEGDAYDG